MKLYIIVPMYNVEKWIRQNLTMLKQQTYKDFHCLLIDDVSTDDTLRTAKNEIADDTRFEIKANMTRKFALRNIFEGISILNLDD